MIPLTLKISGLYSYQEQEQVIDFERLCEGQLFGIFGSVGSGKSSILEAITYALYGKTERMNKGDGEQYNMMNLKSSELNIEFRFRAGQEDRQEYRFCVYGKRQNKNFDKIAKWERTAYELVVDRESQKEEWIPLESNSGERVLGLSYENFRRTIIIPQGKFQEFLHLGPTARTQMLKELFDLQKFDLQDRVSRLNKENNQFLDLKQGELKGKEPVSKEELQNLKTELSAKEKELVNVKKEKDQKELELQQAKQLQDLEKRLASSQHSYSELLLQREEIEVKERELKEYLQAEKYFASDFAGLTEYNRRIQDKLTKLEETNQLFEEVSRKLADEEIEFTAVQGAFEKRERLKEKAEDLDKIVEIISARLKAASIKKESAEEQKALQGIAPQLEKLSSTLAESEKRLTKAKSQIPDLEVFLKLKNWFLRKRELQKEITNSEEKTKNVEITIGQGKDALAKSMDSFGLDASKHLSPQIETKLKNIETGARTLRTELNALEVDKRLAAFAHNLNEGDPCPLCGSSHHPHPLESETTDFKEKQLNEQLAQLEETQSELLAAQAQFNAEETRLRRLASEAAALLSGTTEHKKALEAHNSSYFFPAGLPTDLEALDDVLEQAGKQQKLINTQEIEVSQLRNQQSSLQQQKEKLNTQLQDAIKNLEILKAKAELLRGQLRHASLEKHINKNQAQLLANRDALLLKYDEINQQYQQKRDSVQKLSSAKASQEKERQLLEKDVFTISEELQALLISVNQKVIDLGMGDRKEVQSILDRKPDVEAEQAAIHTWKRQKEVLSSEIERVEKEIDGRSYDPQQRDILEAAIISLNEAYAEVNQHFGALKRDVERKENILKERGDLAKEIEALEKRKENLDTLFQLFKASGFVNYISTVYLQELCNRANLRFRELTRNKLSLEIDEKNNFLIRDFLNGGQIRSVKTLSGGQTFQAALSLALALADNIQQLQESSHNFFFLDEGFGTLDKDSLQVVFDTLKSLRKEKRIVGVISHVEELQQEIDTCLQLTLDEEKGSQVKASWLI